MSCTYGAWYPQALGLIVKLGRFGRPSGHRTERGASLLACHPSVLDT